MKIRGMSVDTFWKGEVRVRAEVEDAGQICRTKIFVKGSQIYDYSCSCVKGNSHRGPCEHGTALLNEFTRKVKEARRFPVSTSPAVRTLIREYTNREVARVIGEEETGKVGLIPRLILGRQTLSLEFRLSRKRQYLIKDLAVFTQAVQSGKRIEYGKGLAFEHSLSAFTPENRPLLKLLLEEAGAYLEHFEAFSRKASTVIPVMRTIVLNRAARDRFFELMQNTVIDVEDPKGQGRKLQIVRGNPQIIVKARKEGGDGISVRVPDEWLAYRGEQGFYVAAGECIYCCDEEYTDQMALFFEHLPENRTAGLMVNHRDIPLFYERVLSRMEALGQLDSDGIDWDAYRPPKLKASFHFDSTEPGEITMRPQLSYGDFSFHPLEDEQIPREICRDVPGEFRVSRLITRYFEYKDGETKNLAIRNDEDAVYRLLSEGIEQFQETGQVWLSESFRRLKILPPPKISFGISLNSGWLELDIDTEGLDRVEMMKILDEYRLKKRYYRLKSGEYLELTDESLSAASELSEGLALSRAELEAGTVRLPSYRAFYLDSLLREEEHFPFERDEAFRQMVRDLKSVEDVNTPVPGTLKQVLREYQKAGYSWLKTLGKYGFGGILADEMGLGKTLQMITVLLSEQEEAAALEAEGKQEHPVSLVVCPASLIYNWGHEFSVFAPSMKVLMVAGTAAERQKELADIQDYDVVITSYDLLKRDLPFYLEHEFRYEIVDEAQYIKNASTQSAKAVKSVRALHRFALTGTPIENRLSELWSIFDFLMPGFLYGYRKFKSMYESPIVKEADEMALKRLQRMIRPFVLRRLKADVLKELPPKLEKVFYSAAEGTQRELYQARALKLKTSLEQGEDNLGSRRFEILTELTRLRQICCDPSLCYENYNGGSAKLETCISLITSAVESGHRILVFSQFSSMLKLIGERLNKESVPYFMLTGSTAKEERNRLVTSFGKNEAPVFLISLKAGGTGLNLTAADLVIHYDPWWNVAAQNQATDRAHRIGQDRQVTVYRLIMKDTIEENILKLQESKRSLAEQIVPEGMLSLGELGREELLEILK